MNNETLQKLNSAIQRVSKKKSFPDPDESLFESGYLDSFALADFVVEVERDFNVRIPDADLNPRRFGSLTRIAEYLGSLGV